MVIFATVSPYILFDAPLTSCLNLADTSSLYWTMFKVQVSINMNLNIYIKVCHGL